MEITIKTLIDNITDETAAERLDIIAGAARTVSEYLADDFDRHADDDRADADLDAIATVRAIAAAQRIANALDFNGGLPGPVDPTPAFYDAIAADLSTVSRYYDDTIDALYNGLHVSKHGPSDNAISAAAVLLAYAGEIDPAEYDGLSDEL